MIKFLYFRLVLLLSVVLSSISTFGQTTSPTVGLVCSNIDLNDTPPSSLSGVDVRSVCSDGYSDRFKFYLVQIRSGNTFTFQLSPTNGGDYDFVSWHNPNLPDVHNITVADINALPAGDRGNRNTGGGGTTIGLALNAPTMCNGVAGNGLERHYDVVPGDYVLIGIDNWSSNSDYTMTFGGNAELDCYFGKTFYECADETTNMATFNLDDYIDEVRPPNDNNPYFFYNSEAEAEANVPSTRISNIQTLPYTEDGKEIFVAFQQTNGMINVVKFVLKTLRTLNAATDTIYGCFEGTNPQNGITFGSFNLNEAIPEEYLTDALVKANYYKTRQDAENETPNSAIPRAEWENHFGVEGTYYLRLEYDLGDETKCTKIIEIDLVIVRVELAETVKNLDVCYGQFVDLTAYETYFAPTANIYTFTYYNGTTVIDNPTSYEVTSTSTITVKIGNGSCLLDATIELNLQDTPIIEFGEMFTICDTNYDGAYDLDLNNIRTYLLNSTGAFTYSFYLSEADAINQTNPIAGDTVDLDLNQEVWVRANNDGICFYIATVPLLYGEMIQYTAPVTNLSTCADENGNGTFDLTSVLTELGIGAGVTVKYFPTREDAIANTNEITTPTAWVTNTATGTIFIHLVESDRCNAITTVPFTVNPLPVITIENEILICEDETYTLDLSQYADYTFTISGNVTEVTTKVYRISETGTYTVTVTSNAGCVSTLNFDVQVAAKPTFTAMTTYDVCDANIDGNYEVDLVVLSGLVVENNTGVTLSFYASEADLLANVNAITADIYTTRLPAQVWVKASNAQNCFDYKAIQLVAGDVIVIAPSTTALEACIGQNRTTEFDLTSMRARMNIPANYIVSYFLTLEDLQNGANEILNPTLWTTNNTTGTIFVKLEAPDMCPSYTTFDYVANPLPAVDLEELYYICNDDSFQLDLSAYDYTIQVTGPNAVALGGNIFNISATGTYTVVATNNFGCTSTYTFEVSLFHEPVISEIIVGLNTITVKLVRNDSYPNVQYSLDGVNFQNSNILTIPQRGINYDIYVKIGECIYLIYTVETIEIPTFFSPNNDGFNDVWKIRPTTVTQELDLKIFDRFGKIVYEQKGNQDINWNGIFNGKKLPTTDYWFTIDLQGNDVVKAIKYSGSITLKNK